MRLRILVALTILLGNHIMYANADEALSLEAGAFGLKWGTPYDEVKATHPLMSTVPGVYSSAIVRGDYTFEGFAVTVLSVRFDQATKELSAISFDIESKHQQKLINELIASLGEPRRMAMQEGASYSHVLEWSRPAFSVTAHLATKGPATMEPTSLAAVIRLQRGPILDSSIDRAEQLRQRLKDRKPEAK